MAWNLDSDRPIYTQLLEQIQLQIVSGRYRPGDKLPSVRELAAEASVNPNTMQRAFAELERSGLIETRRTSGRFVTEDTEMISRVRIGLAREELEMFAAKMKTLGFSGTEVTALLSSAFSDGQETTVSKGKQELTAPAGGPRQPNTDFTTTQERSTENE